MAYIYCETDCAGEKQGAFLLFTDLFVLYCFTLFLVVPFPIVPSPLCQKKIPMKEFSPSFLFLCTADVCTDDGKWYIIRVSG